MTTPVAGVALDSESVKLAPAPPSTGKDNP